MAKPMASRGQHPAANSPATQLLTAKEAAAQLGVSVSYIRNSDLPKVALPSGRGTKRAIVRVRQSDLDAWVASHMKRSA